MRAKHSSPCHAAPFSAARRSPHRRRHSARHDHGCAHGTFWLHCTALMAYAALRAVCTMSQLSHYILASCLHHKGWQTHVFAEKEHNACAWLISLLSKPFFFFFHVAHILHKIDIPTQHVLTLAWLQHGCIVAWEPPVKVWHGMA